MYPGPLFIQQFLVSPPPELVDTNHPVSRVNCENPFPNLGPRHPNSSTQTIHFSELIGVPHLLTLGVPAPKLFLIQFGTIF